MNNRGENSFIKLPRFGAKLYDLLSRTKGIENQVNEIALDLTSKIDQGRLLDVGTGPGKLLVAIHRLNPGIELYGLDISSSMINQAKKNTTGINMVLKTGNIEKTDYETDYFDLVTCTGSFYLWNRPIDCLEEINRILKPRESAYLYETYGEFNKDEFILGLNENLKNENLLRKKTTPYFLKRQLKMTYTIGEVEEIVNQTSFKHKYEIERIKLAGLPIWMRITLTKT